MYVASLVLWILMYVFFGKEGCGAQLTITTLTIILCIVLTGIACSKLAPHGTILTSGVVTLYASYLGYSALASNPDKNCNPLAEGSMESASDLTMGLLVAGISIAVTANSATGNKEVRARHTRTHLPAPTYPHANPVPCTSTHVPAPRARTHVFARARNPLPAPHSRTLVPAPP